MTTSPYNIKSVYENLVSLLPHIINSYISENLFLVQWKMAKISPIPKSDDPQKFDDYRPVSALPLFSKVYEWLIAKQLCAFLERSCTLKDTMAGFRNLHSPNTFFYWKFVTIFYVECPKENLLNRFTVITQKLLIQFKTIQLFKSSIKLFSRQQH